ncbi:MAG: Asp23/Gls24 family envelope stress response protein [Finegoldia magna]|nr:Asp23/Gls24 family envelope stress response protein [Finegoldia magna]
MEYGTKIAVVCQNIIDTVKYSVENKTGLEVECVNVLVQDMRINEEK